ncbi:uncharacterized protein LOC123274496 [Cotesia glomerata]|uniref:Uncharacterized protein n=1 Tax=Cotesia glomerata TaxID=32391 RepID=A0AAV7IKS5_COTGL|nr:uncharacterized protein LOC123274496 [Cotesia glomerata]KAH0562882.1 hypothetical protein KQX54_001282 [Cotesia glomerata]
MELNPECQDIEVNNNQVTDYDNTIDCLLDKFTEKYVQVELIKELVIRGEANLRKRKEDLKDKLKKLNDLHNRIFQVENDFCESIWKFKAEHDFASVINQILDDETTNYEENDEIRLEKISSAKHDVQELISSIDDVIINIDKELIDINQKLAAKVKKELKKPFDDETKYSVPAIKSENLIAIKKEPHLKTPVKLETPEYPTNKLSKNFSVKKKSSICKKFEMSC